MIKHLKDTYRRCPIMNEYGCGVYSYTLFCIDNITSNQYRYEIRANSLDEALMFANQFLNSTSTFTALDDTTLEVYFTAYPSYFSYLFL